MYYFFMSYTFYVLLLLSIFMRGLAFVSLLTRPQLFFAHLVQKHENQWFAYLEPTEQHMCRDNSEMFSLWGHMNGSLKGVTRGYKDGLQPESLADGNWLVKQNQPVPKIETKSDTILRSLYESWFRNALISKSVILWWQVKKGINSELEGANACRVLNVPSKRSLYLMRSSHTSAHLQKKRTCFSSWTSPHSHLSQMLEPPCHCKTPLSNGVHAIWTCWNSSSHVCPNPCTSRRG